MAFTHTKQPCVTFHKALVFQLLVASVFFQSCTSHKKIYKSNCDDNIVFKHIGFSQLIDSIKSYDQKYVEVVGTYKEAKEQSALFNDSLFVDHSNSHALWINFTQDCPLYLIGTHIGLFEYNDGKFTQINNKKITIRGKIDVRHKGHLGSYKGSIDRVSFVEM
jgi:hypothetical protein